MGEQQAFACDQPACVSSLHLLDRLMQGSR
jgi:hypothetical protein